MATPLINALRVQGGTFYTFSSASNDISKTFTDDDARFVFSKFVLLDLPDVATPSSNRENYIVWEGIGSKGTGISSIPASDLSNDDNINFAQVFQNYLLNHEQLILEGSNTLASSYDNKELSTVSERLFWKWLSNINAIRFRNATASEASVSNRFTEEDPGNFYKKVVKYIGDIDVVNNVSRDGHAYSEVYLNVPVTHGDTPLILFKNYADRNYTPGIEWQGTPLYIDGRDSGSTHPSGLSLSPYYDNDTTNRYTATIFGDVTNWSGTAVSPGNLSPKPVLLSMMDGLVLDTDANSYKPIVDDPNISLISEFNATDSSQDFSFNVALIYYDVYSASNSLNRGRNLYGILVLDNFVNEGSGSSSIKRFDKFKPNKVTKLNGNGYGLKFNLKFDTSADNVGVETIINDYQTFSMDLFIDASTRMQEAADLFLDTKKEIIEIKNELNELRQYYFSQGTLNGMSQRLSELEKSLNNAKLAFSSPTSLLDLINKNADNIQKILSGKLSLNLTYNTDILKSGDGLLVDKSVPNQIKLVNRVQKYSNFMICKNSSKYLLTDNGNGKTFTSTTNNNIIVLDKFTNYFRQKNQNADSNGVETFQDNFYINVDDKNYKWKNGQTLKLVFENKIKTNNYNIVFKTDSQNRFGNGQYNKIIGTVQTSQLFPLTDGSYMPIIEIICIDENQYLFNIDILR